MSETKRKLIELLCEGYSHQEIINKLDISKYEFKKLRGGVGLPAHTKSFPEQKENILSNLKKLEDYNKAREKLRINYFNSIHDFDYE